MNRMVVGVLFTQSRTLPSFPGCASLVQARKSILPVVVMDSGLALRRAPGMTTVKIPFLFLPRLRAGGTLLLLAPIQASGASPKSSASKTCRIRFSEPSSNGARFIHSNRLVQRFDLDQPETGNQIAGKAERDRDLTVASLAWKLNARAPSSSGAAPRLRALTPALHHLFV